MLFNSMIRKAKRRIVDSVNQSHQVNLKKNIKENKMIPMFDEETAKNYYILQYQRIDDIFTKQQQRK